MIMDHSLVAEQFGVRLRPVRLEDAAFIVQLRNSQHAIGNVGDTGSAISAQELWLQHYFERIGDYYFIIEKARTGEPLGTVGIYNIIGQQGETGRWIIVPDSPAAAASSLLTWRIGFELLKLEHLLARIVETNKPVLAFHKRIGNPYIGRFEDEQQIAGKSVAMIHFRATPAEWPAISKKLSHYARLAEKFL